MAYCCIGPSYLYCLLLPFGLVDAIGYAMSLISVSVSDTFLALEAIAGEISAPSSDAANGLPLNAICVEIERSVLALPGEPMPEPVRCNKDYRLSGRSAAEHTAQAAHDNFLSRWPLARISSISVSAGFPCLG